MANVFNKLIDSLKFDDDLDDDEEEFEPSEEFDDLDYREETRRSSSQRVGHDPSLDLDDDLDDVPQKKSHFRPRKQPTPVVSMNNKGSMEVCMVKPVSVAESKEIIDILLSGKAVVINMENIDDPMAQRIIDFTSGACYAMNGNLQAISSYIFIVTPSNINLSGDFESDTSNVLDVDM